MIGFVVCCCQSVNTICVRIMVGLVFVVVRQQTQYVFVLWLGLLLSSVSKYNMWSYYDWIYCCCRSSVITICGRVMVALVVVVINQ